MSETTKEHNDPEPFGYYVLRTVGDKEFAGEFQLTEVEEVPGVAVTPLYMRPEPSATAAEAVAHLRHLLDEARAVYSAAESSGKVKIDLGHYRRLTHGMQLLHALGAVDAEPFLWLTQHDFNEMRMPASSSRSITGWRQPQDKQGNDLVPLFVGAQRVNADLLEMLKHAVHWHDQLTPADIARYEAVISKAEGSQP